jgi:uncharacterized protein
MTPKRFVLALAAVVLTLAAGGVYAVLQADPASGGQTPPQRITVTGTGVVSTTPDRADFSFGVQTRRTTAAAAMARNAAKMQQVIDAVRAAGVAAKDLQTQQVSISPEYSDSSLLGYIASSSVTAKIRDLGHAGSVIDAAVAAGAVTVYGPALFRVDRQDLARAALRAAIADARSKAQALAAASDATLGRVLAVVEQGATPAASGTTGTTGTTGTSGTTGGVPTPFVPGEQSIEATASVTFTAS